MYHRRAFPYPVQTLSVLCRHKSGIDTDRLEAERLSDAFADSTAHRFIIFVYEKSGFGFFYCPDILAEQFPTYSRSFCFTVVLLGDAPISARTSTDDEINAFILREVSLEHIAVFLYLRKVVRGCLHGVLVDLIGIVAFDRDPCFNQGYHSASHSVKQA